VRSLCVVSSSASARSASQSTAWCQCLIVELHGIHMGNSPWSLLQSKNLETSLWNDFWPIFVSKLKIKFTLVFRKSPIKIIFFLEIFKYLFLHDLLLMNALQSLFHFESYSIFGIWNTNFSFFNILMLRLTLEIF